VKVIIAGGGTGGHLFPAVALGEEIKRECSAAEVLFVGAAGGIEAKWLARHGLPHELFAVHGFSGKSSRARLRALREFFSAVISGRDLLRGFGGEVVVSAGGYAAAPMAVAALLRGIPLILMEQNTRPGLANRLLWRFAHKICLGFPDAAAAFAPSKVVVTGNPVRFSRMPQVGRPPADPLQLLVLGGSSGAHRLNLGALNAFKILRETAPRWSIAHQTGEADAGWAAEVYGALGCNARVAPFIDDVADALDRADLVIARAGAMTVSEIALAGRAAVFVPYPFHRDRQQEHNAQVLARSGGAVIVRDDEQLDQNLAKQLQRLCGHPQSLQDMARRAHQAAMPDAARRIARLCLELAAGRRSRA